MEMEMNLDVCSEAITDSRISYTYPLDINCSVKNINISLPSNSSSSFDYPDFSQNAVVRSLFVCAFIVVGIFGTLGNLLVCLTIFRNKSMHSPINYYIVNLGICDFLVGFFVLPIKLFELTADANLNVLNDQWCTAVRFLETYFVFASVLILLAICLERYYAVVYPVHSRVHMTEHRTIRVLLCVWTIPLFVAAPNAYPAIAATYYLSSEYGTFDRLTCMDNFSDEFRRYYYMFLFFFMYCIPLVFIVTTCFCITRVLMTKTSLHTRNDSRAVSLEHQRHKVAKMVLVIIISYIVCWSPYFIVTIVTQFQAENFLEKGQYFFTMLCINILCFLNSCINPIIYLIMSTRFRKGFIGVIQWICFCSKKQIFRPDNSPLPFKQSSRQNYSRQTSYNQYQCPTSIDTDRWLSNRRVTEIEDNLELNPLPSVINFPESLGRQAPRCTPQCSLDNMPRSISVNMDNGNCSVSSQLIPLKSMRTNHTTTSNEQSPDSLFKIERASEV